jgi:hypothetical protein
MPFQPPMLDYRSVDSQPVKIRRGWRQKSAGEIAARISGFGLFLLACVLVLIPIGGYAGPIAMLLILVTIAVSVIGGIISVIAVFEAREVRSHVRLGCSMALALLVCIIGLMVVGFVMG